MPVLGARRKSGMYNVVRRKAGAVLRGAGKGIELYSELKNGSAFAHDLISNHVCVFCLSGFFSY